MVVFSGPFRSAKGLRRPEVEEVDEDDPEEEDDSEDEDEAGASST